MSNISLVMVTMTLYKKGDTISASAGNDEFWELPFEKTTVRLPEENRKDFWGQLSKHDMVFTGPNSVLDFELFGNAANGVHICALDFLADNMGYTELFDEECCKNFREHARDFLQGTENSYCNFVTVWEYDAWKDPDTWLGSGEYNEEGNFLGYLDLSKTADGGLKICN